MRKIIILIILACGIISRAYADNAVIANTPNVAIFYASMFDTVCSAKTAYKIDSIWIQDLMNQLPHWRKLWNDEGIILLDATTKLVHRPFAQCNFQVSLSLFSFPSMSAPLIVNARYALQSFTNKPIPDYVFISTIYHELLHNYIDSFLPKNTPLLVKYKNESSGVLSHLHLLALEKAVYLHLGWKSKLNKIIKKDESLLNGDYKRAWEIINKNDNYKNFIDELRAFNKNRILEPNVI